MLGKNVSVGFRVNQNRIMFLDGWGTKNLVSRKRDRKWKKYEINENMLEVGKFREKYPLVSDGLAVALGGGNQLLMASYGKLPLAAVLLRPEGGLLKVVARSSDDIVKAIAIQDHDIVVVGSLAKILELKDLKLGTSGASDTIFKEIFDPKTEKSICIVVTVSNNQSPQSARPIAKLSSPPGSRRRKTKLENTPSSGS
jgi:hypothetical protein